MSFWKYKCRCGLCHTLLGEKCGIPQVLKESNNAYVKKSKSSFLLSKESITTSQESNVKISKIGESVYVMICRICKSTLVVNISTKRVNNCVALISDSWKKVVDEKPVLRNDSKINDICELIKFDGVNSSPVMMRDAAFGNDESLNSIDCNYDLFEEQFDIINDCIFGSLYISPNQAVLAATA
jgi:hypothetical protein